MHRVVEPAGKLSEVSTSGFAFLRNDVQLLGLMAARKRQNVRHKFPEKLVRVHKYCKVSSGNRHEIFSRRLNRIEIFPGKLCRRGEIFCSLEEKHRNRKLEPEILHGCGLGLGDEAVPAQHLAIDSVV